MTANEQRSIYVRIIEIPAVKMVRSGDGSLDDFNRWWSAVDAAQKQKIYPHDFMWFNPQLGNLEWMYVLPEGLTDTGGYEVFDFPGGLYAVEACRDEEAEIMETSKKIHQWVEESPLFEKAPESSGCYEMGHIITPKNAREILGYHQMELYVPIVRKNSK